MTDENDTFGPWSEDGDNDLVDESLFWQHSTSGIIDLGTRSEWDKCQLGTFILPGVAHVSIPKPADRKVDVKSPDGKSKATLTIKGWEPAEVEIQLLLWTPAQWSEWRKIRPLLRDPTDRKESDPFEIHHPVTYDSGIDSVLIKTVGGISDGSIKGTKTVKISSIEWVPQPKNTGSGTPKTQKQPNRADLEYQYTTERYNGLTTDPWQVWAYNRGLDPPGFHPLSPD